MPFFDLSKKTFDQKQVDKLHQALMKAGRYKHRTSKAKATNEFRLLRQHHSQDAISSLLKWYCDHLKDEFVPIVHSARGFRHKFDAIQASYTRDPKLLKETRITKDAKKVAAHLVYLRWPGKEKEQELLAIQLTISNYQRFLKELQEQLKKAMEEDTESIFLILRHIARMICLSPNQFTVDYIEDVCKLAHRWDKWQGELLNWVWTIDNKDWNKRMHALVQSYCGRSEWERIKGMIKKELICTTHTD